MTHQQSDLSRALFFLLLAIFLFDVMSAIIKHLGTRYPVAQLSVYRNLFGVIPSVLLLIFSGNWISDGRQLVIRQWRLGLVRGLIGTFAQLTFYFSLTKLEFATASAIAFSGPLFITALSIPILKHHIGLWRWLAILIGFAGIVMVMNPGAAVFNIYAVLPLLAAFGYATISVTAALFDKSTPTALVNLYVSAGAIVGSVSFMLLTQSYQSIASITDWIWLIAMGSAGGAAVFCIMTAYRLTAPSNLSPFEYFGIPVSFIIGWVFFSEAPFERLFPGVIFIISGGLLIVWRQRFLKSRDVV
ncbi:MAG: drug/metabolite transporter (DMT)-like permease [Parasphingorhabdus sp.]